ncbi:methyltransferase domain-containing protein [Candidatus Uhrbacteria bacterium]|nr:methyltransferase domain-containing protein [Candidatus Uhrbacteria bacterium]
MASPSASELLNPVNLLQEAGIRAGMSVADFGCGTLGHFVFAAAKLVGPEGKVYAVDILKSVLAGVESRMKLEGVTNISTIWGDIERLNGVKLADGALDIALLVNNMFLAKDKGMLVKETARTVKSGGRLVLVDWKPAGAVGPDPASRVEAEVSKKFGLDAGLTLEKEFVPGPYHYGYIFVKP